MQTKEITLKCDDKLSEKIKMLKMFYEASWPGGAHYTEEELLKILIENAFSEMKLDPVGKRMFW